MESMLEPASNNVISQLTIEYNEIIGNDNKGIGFWKVDWEAGNLHDVTIRGNTISDNLNTGISTYGAGPYFIIDNIVTGNAGNGISIKYDDGDIISGNTVTGNDAMGINMHQVTNTIVEDNTVSGHVSEEVVTTFWGGSIVAGKGSAIYVHEASQNNIIRLNDLTANKIGILISRESEGDDPSGNSIYNNGITGNTVNGILNALVDPATPVDAENNYWGAASGPAHATNLDGTGDTVSDNVDFDPWCSDSACTAIADEASTISYSSTWASTVKAALDWLFERSPHDTEGIDIYLTQGWNTFKMPWFVLTGTDQVNGLDVADYNVETVLADVYSQVSYLAYYNGIEWQTYVPNDPAATTFTEFPTTATQEDFDFHIYMGEGARLTIPTIIT